MRSEKPCSHPRYDRDLNERARRTAHFLVGKGRRGIERLEVRIRGKGFLPHRHDTYAIGVTLFGIQTFRYRGSQRYCVPHQCHILHPDEVHDGSSATEAEFGYRIIYVDPSLVQNTLGGKPLPFVENPIVEPGSLQMRMLSRIWDVADDLDDVDDEEIISSIASLLQSASSDFRPTNRGLPLKALQRVREVLAAEPASRQTVEEMEGISGLDRWTLAREFRIAYGTSPRAFRTMRQLDKVRRLVVEGASLADAALEAGFADQSHMSRMFKNAYGLTPVRWATAVMQGVAPVSRGRKNPPA